MTDECRYPFCSEPSRDEPGYAGRFCSTRCELRYEHARADARDAQIAADRERDLEPEREAELRSQP